jgi:hypothetical protein
MPTLGAVSSAANIPQGTQQAVIANLTDSTGGSDGSELVDVTTLAIADPAKINNNFATMNADLNAIKAALRNFQIIAT